MAIGFDKDVADVIPRGGGVFISDDEGVTYEDLGRVKGVMMEISPEETEPDTGGQTVDLASNVTLTVVMTQTSDAQISLLAQLKAFTPTGLWTKFTSEFTDADGAGAADGYLFKNILWKVGMNIPFNNTESQVTLTTTFRVPNSELTALGTTQIMVVGI